MTFADTSFLAPTPDSTLIDFIWSEVRDAVIFFRPRSATLRALVEAAPAAGDCVTCVHDSLAELRVLIWQAENKRDLAHRILSRQDHGSQRVFPPAGGLLLSRGLGNILLRTQ
jgi:hypothetical protein